MQKIKKYIKPFIIWILSITLIITIILVKNIYFNNSSNELFNYNKIQLSKLPKNVNNFSFAVMWDNRDGDYVLRKIIKDTNSDKNIIFDINWWDLVPDGYKKEFWKYLNLIKTSKKPFLSVIWNHELPWYDWETNYKQMFWKTYFSFTIWDNYFIVLDDSNEKDLDKQQFSWLKSELEKAKNYKNKFIFMHVPLYDPRKWNLKEWHSLSDLKQAKQLNDLFDENKITMVFASHIHFYYKWKWQKTPFIISGWAWAPLKKYKKHWFYNYVKVTINNDKVRYQVIKVNVKPLWLINKIIQSIKDTFNF